MKILFRNTIYILTFILLVYCDSENSSWDKVLQENNIDGYKEFVEKYPNSIHKDSAEERIVDLEEQNYWLKHFEIKEQLNLKGRILEVSTEPILDEEHGAISYTSYWVEENHTMKYQAYFNNYLKLGENYHSEKGRDCGIYLERYKKNLRLNNSILKMSGIIAEPKTKKDLSVIEDKISTLRNEMEPYLDSNEDIPEKISREFYLYAYWRTYLENDSDNRFLIINKIDK